MSAQPKPCISQEEYLRRERLADYKSEYYRGEIFPMTPELRSDTSEMAGARAVHSAINANTIAALINGLRGRPCSVFTSDLRVHIPANTLYTYPDASVVCGKTEMLDNEFDTLLNPLLIVEVLSDSTEDYARNGKFRLYRSIPSLREYILVSQYEHVIASYFLNDQRQWIYTDAEGVESALYLASLDMSLSFADVYANLDLPPRPLRS